ncbi:acyl-CoA dehydrogenase family protein [Microbacterium sp. JZ31]|uniref:acyl-CoA dehydrogenase family protein n=1 Tax=Microbacterium sp. JZ31 TaxID=1906274 RepID=UPI001932FE86|nr:acyl-CoA dehydrogenase family protein [Microbacterium sp. JZ31]
MSDDLVPRRAARARRAPWADRLEEAATQLADGIVRRERVGEAPHDAFAVLRRLGLIGLTVPAELGGEGATLAETSEAARRLARVDGGLAHAVGYHWVWLWFVSAYGVHGSEPAAPTAPARELARRTAVDGLVWASIGSAFGGSGGTVRSAGGYAVSARRGFATGAPLADLLFTQSVLDEDGRMRVWAIPTDREGVTVSGDWDPVGQRLSASPGVVLDDVRATDDDLVAIVSPPSEHPLPLQSLMIPAFQSLFGWLAVGIAEGALLEARDYVRGHGRPWVHSAADTATEDVHVVAGFGRQVAAVSAAAALVREGAAELDALAAAPTSVTPAQRGEVAEVIAAGKIAAHHAGLDAASAVFDLTGARSASASFGLDRHWRNLRTLTLHDPVAYKHEELGRYFLSGDLPIPSVYR